ncbi:unnamed protein product [Medioppia subpectinata]|uniref:BTB domain-containing protein n=1 Tax=Medioppia subpectinata TaxID=1979941 RepID=A0A7R9KIK1_9ACAR|nr:unnamed protein product [Medioppia subpectinata]CAG2104343.1 unnamed protein product [Medioppia subpectinata]
MSVNHSSNQTIAEDIVPEDTYPEMDESESDVVFVVNGHRIPGAKGIFGFKSRVFRAMFAAPFAESTAPEIAIDDPMITVNAFKAMRRFIYTEEVVLSGGEDLDEVCAVMRCAHKYQILRLVNKMADKLSSMLDIHNVKTIAEMAANYDNKPLMDSVNAFLLKKPYLLIAKDMDYLKALNDMTGGQCFEAMVKSMLKTHIAVDPLPSVPVMVMRLEVTGRLFRYHFVMSTKITITITITATNTETTMPALAVIQGSSDWLSVEGREILAAVVVVGVIEVNKSDDCLTGAKSLEFDVVLIITSDGAYDWLAMNDQFVQNFHMCPNFGYFLIKH